jgi:hypothetical protein
VLAKYRSNGDNLSRWPSGHTKGWLVPSLIVSRSVIRFHCVCHRLDSRWGANAHEFNPSRWLEGATYQGEALGPYANLWVAQFFTVALFSSFTARICSLTFLGGPRACLG